MSAGFRYRPGNALIDDWALRHTGRPVDEGGRLAASGQGRQQGLGGAHDPSLFRPSAAKSLDRDAFEPAGLSGLTLPMVRRHWSPSPPPRWPARAIACRPARSVGCHRGGRHNPVLMSALRTALGVPVEPVESVGWDGDARGGPSLRYLAVRSLAGLPLSLP